MSDAVFRAPFAAIGVKNAVISCLIGAKGPLGALLRVLPSGHTWEQPCKLDLIPGKLRAKNNLTKLFLNSRRLTCARVLKALSGCNQMIIIRSAHFNFGLP
jgi:hypothetical protein